MERREALGTLVGGIATTALVRGGMSTAETTPTSTPASGPAGQHSVKPLPFDPAKLPGLSEKLLRSHHDNNYAGAVKNLNKVEAELARITKDTDGFIVNGLKERELTYTNSLILHEHYFGNLGGDGKTGGSVEKAIAATFGSFARWEELFRATGMSLAGGSGWTVLAWNFDAHGMGIYWSGNHTQALASGLPLLVLDMYEHAFQMDYGAAAAKYLDAFFKNLNWEEVDRRYEEALKVSRVMK
jgi:superoxide dismutase, Fe-Mn family